ncbi:hypothetical protein AQJ30_25530 [Streptomyces longwoodensis]|uniref:MEDS domain-containing protein n=1 Tax=Streptomyces longwoodensis TaxID=68231 RepID=A0A117QLU8_9ACTN|nr:MEDS domain-containing protein [Streptomyces longwoodensis]KUN35489.1 hypothetical protein AQJ30_25530 [Streptomyces longwoodensis]
MTAPAPHRPHGGLTHQGLVYGSDEEFLAATVPFCREGLTRGDAVLAVTTGTNIGLLRRALADVSGQVEYVDAQDWYHHPGATLGAYHRYVDRCTATGAHQRVRVIGEPVWHGHAVQHGDGAGRLVLRRCGPHIVADVINTGEAEAAWYLGHLPPDPRQPRGHGMWAVRHLCDLLEVHTDQEVTTVRLHMGLD